METEDEDMDEGGEAEENYTAEAATFIATLMVAAPVAHMLHLQTKSYATHKALEELYTGLPEKVDALAECYQGCYGIIAKYPRMALPPLEKPIHFVASLIEYVEGHNVTLTVPRNNLALTLAQGRFPAIGHIQSFLESAELRKLEAGYVRTTPYPYPGMSELLLTLILTLTRTIVLTPTLTQALALAPTLTQALTNSNPM